MIVKQLTKNKRLAIVRWFLPAIWSPVYKLQVKTIFGWITVSWIYVEQFVNDEIKDVIHWLEWDFNGKHD